MGEIGRWSGSLTPALTVVVSERGAELSRQRCARVGWGSGAHGQSRDLHHRRERRDSICWWDVTELTTGRGLWCWPDTSRDKFRWEWCGVVGSSRERFGIGGVFDFNGSQVFWGRADTRGCCGLRLSHQRPSRLHPIEFFGERSYSLWW